MVRTWGGGVGLCWMTGTKRSWPQDLFFHMGGDVRGITQGQNIAPDLLESVMRPTRPATEEFQSHVFQNDSI